MFLLSFIFQLSGFSHIACSVHSNVLTHTAITIFRIKMEEGCIVIHRPCNGSKGGDAEHGDIQWEWDMD
jgi:hypothetical protein